MRHTGWHHESFPGFMVACAALAWADPETRKAYWEDFMNWRKAPCAAGECPEIAEDDGGVLLRSTLRPDAVIRLSPVEFRNLREAIRDGGLGGDDVDLPGEFWAPVSRRADRRARRRRTPAVPGRDLPAA